MKRSQALRSFFILVLSCCLLAAAGCGKKAAPTRIPPPSPKAKAGADSLAPQVTLAVSPATIRQGESVMLSWEAKNADSLAIDTGIGSVPLSGSRSLMPTATTTYTATATSGAGTASASARVVVSGKLPTTEMSVPAATPPLDIRVETLFDQSVRDVFFEYDKYELSPEAVEILYANAKFLRQFSQLRIVIEGHCDERGTAEYNLALGDRRAKVTKDFLLGLGIAADRISTISYGEERPFDNGQSEEAWVKNRRAHFTLARP